MSMDNIDKKVVLCILDGLGYTKSHSNNAFYSAKTPMFDLLFSHAPNTLLSASGIIVGLPDDNCIGNSEVGHLTIGSGRTVKQGLSNINEYIAQGKLANNEKLLAMIRELESLPQASCHLLVLLSDGGVHSHINHLFSLISILIQHDINIKLHIFTDGRDVPPKSALLYYEEIKNRISGVNDDKLMIASISGRYYAMDRDKKFDRTALAYSAIAFGDSSVKFSQNDENDNLLSVEGLIKASYGNGINDEFIIPSANISYSGIQKSDSIIMLNFRADRVRQILSMLLMPESLKPFNCNQLNFKRALEITNAISCCLGFSKYSTILSESIVNLFPDIKVEDTLGYVLSSHGKKQLRLAETEKYAHVTFFFNGGVEEQFAGEDRVIIPSPNVATYDLKPEMSALEVTDSLIQAMQSQCYDFICVNFANADMVGHTGNIKAAITACEVLDNCIKKIVDNLPLNTDLLITSDHGNVEEMFNFESNQPHTAHTKNLVPFIYVNKELLLAYNNTEEKINLRISNASLADVAPTILDLLRLPKPLAMTGKSLIS